MAFTGEKNCRLDERLEERGDKRTKRKLNIIFRDFTRGGGGGTHSARLDILFGILRVSPVVVHKASCAHTALAHTVAAADPWGFTTHAMRFLIETSSASAGEYRSQHQLLVYSLVRF
jgi:hypothetical protein